MVQGPQELVSDFAHGFCDVQTELTKLIPGIHMTPKREDLELQYAFAIKLRKKLQSEIISREFTYNSLQEVIQVAARYEKIHPPTVSGWQPDALISNPSAHSKPSRGNTPPSFTPCKFCRKTNHASQNCFFKQEQKPSRPTGPAAQNLTKVKIPPEQTTCQKFNTFVKLSCELPNGTCSFRRQHICLVCKKPKCKKIKHFPALSQPTINIDPSQQPVIINQLQNLNSNMTTVSTRLSKLEQQNTVSSPQTPDTPSRTVVVPTPGPSSQGVLGLPAISDLGSLFD